MKTQCYAIALLAAVSSTALLAGCSDRYSSVDDLPEATDVTCQRDNLDRIKDKDLRNAMVDRCVRRVKFEKSEPRSW